MGLVFSLPGMAAHLNRSRASRQRSHQPTHPQAHPPTSSRIHRLQYTNNANAMGMGTIASICIAAGAWKNL